MKECSVLFWNKECLENLCWNSVPEHKIGELEQLFGVTKAFTPVVFLGSSVFLPHLLPVTMACVNWALQSQAMTIFVSWFRRRDWHILTAGLQTYTTDARFTVLHKEDSDDWTLQIKYTTRRDNGTYECQLSTGTGVLSQFLNLHVVVPKAVILGSSDYHVQLGSTIKLTCVIEQSPTPPQYVFWYHNDQMINYDNRRGGINVSSESGPKTRSYLTITDAAYEDSGNYSCAASNTESASTNVFVSYGDKMAAIQRRKSAANFMQSSSAWTVVTSLVILMGHFYTFKMSSLKPDSHLSSCYLCRR